MRYSNLDDVSAAERCASMINKNGVHRFEAQPCFAAPCVQLTRTHIVHLRPQVSFSIRTIFIRVRRNGNNTSAPDHNAVGLIYKSSSECETCERSTMEKLDIKVNEEYFTLPLDSTALSSSGMPAGPGVTKEQAPYVRLERRTTSLRYSSTHNVDLKLRRTLCKKSRGSFAEVSCSNCTTAPASHPYISPGTVFIHL